jgi:hypothetical protein
MNEDIIVDLDPQFPQDIQVDVSSQNVEVIPATDIVLDLDQLT